MNKNLEDDSDGEENEEEKDRGQSGEGLKRKAFFFGGGEMRQALPDQGVFKDDWETRATIIMRQEK